MKQRGNLEVDKNIMFNWIPEGYSVKVWTGLSYVQRCFSIITVVNEYKYNIHFPKRSNRNKSQPYIPQNSFWISFIITEFLKFIVLDAETDEQIGQAAAADIILKPNK